MRIYIPDPIEKHNCGSEEKFLIENYHETQIPKVEKTHPHGSWLLHFSAGAISGPISRTITAPIDRVRVEIQVAPHKMTMFEGARSIYQHSGIIGYWRGNGINVAKVGFEMAVRFGMFDRIKQFFENPDGSPLTLPQRFVSGGVAGVLGNFCIYPLEVMKVRMMVNKGEFRSYFDATYKMLKFEGITCFYRGFLTSSIGMMQYTGIDLTIYELLKNRYIYTSIKNNERPPTWKLLTCACIAVTCGQLSAYPFYLIKARRQAKSTHASLKSSRLYRIIILTVQQDGILGLYRGVLLTLYKVLPAGIMNYYFYEQARLFLTPYFEEKEL